MPPWEREGQPHLLKPLHPQEEGKSRKKIVCFTILCITIIALCVMVDLAMPMFPLHDKRLRPIKLDDTERNILDGVIEYHKPVGPETPKLPHVNESYSKWEIPEKLRNELFQVVLKAPVNRKTGRHCITFTTINEGQVEFALNMYCSMRLVGIEKNQHVFICFDLPAHEKMLSIGAQSLLMEGANFTRQAVNVRHILEFTELLKVKPTIMYLLSMWGVEVIHIDADIVFLENPLDLFSDTADFEAQCDSDLYVQVPSDVKPIAWEVNLGYFKIHPTRTVLDFFPIWLEHSYTSPKANEQGILKKLMKWKPKKWYNADSMVVDVTSLIDPENKKDTRTLTIRLLDPMLVTNAGGVFLDGKELWKKEAVRRGIARPKLMHFFHIGFIREKRRIIKEQDLLFTQDEKCVNQQTKMAAHWPIWNVTVV